MASHRKKSKFTVYLDPDVTQALAAFAARRDQSQSMIAEAAIASFLSPDDAERREAVVAKRLDQIDRRMSRLERDVGIAVETLAVFIRLWITTTPALPGPASPAEAAWMAAFSASTFVCSVMSEISSTISPISCEDSPRRLIRLEVSWI